MRAWRCWGGADRRLTADALLIKINAWMSSGAVAMRSLATMTALAAACPVSSAQQNESDFAFCRNQISQRDDAGLSNTSMTFIEIF